MRENVEVVNIQPTKSDTSNTSQKNDPKIVSLSSNAKPESKHTSQSPISKEFKFVNNSPNSMLKPRNRMKPTFKVETQPISGHSNISYNNESVIIEQTFNKADTANDKKYVFQLNVKRPPGRPRKHPVEDIKAKRPQGRPRKYPVEVSGTSALSAEASKITKKHSKEAHVHSTPEDSDSASHEIINENDQYSIPIDTELALASAARRGRGRPKRNERDGKDKDKEENESTAAAAVAVAAALNEAGSPDPAK